jgi:hypothetical protein
VNVTWRDGSFDGNPGGSVEEPAGDLGRGLVYREFCGMDEGGSKAVASLSLSVKRLTAEDLEGGLLYWGPWVMKGRHWRRACLFMRAQLATRSWIVYRGL